MATIKPIEGRSVHQIQSGQVIVDLNSVVKELVENSLDAGATSIEVRFKNHGLDSVEVQDNGKGIAPDDYETVALKHHTSKLSSYEDLTGLDTFGFRGEALSSLCALSKFYITTARADDNSKGKRLDFEVSGKLKNASVVAAPRGTTVSVENLFCTLPVRRKELEKNVKREYGKVLGLLQAYACISVGVRLSISNQMPKSKKIPVFSTKFNTSTKENITNVFGAKTLLALVKLDLHLPMSPNQAITQKGRNWSTQAANRFRDVHVQGHISRPVFGEGRQAPDRQMFFVNSRPCGLPQVAKAFNEIYKSFNVSQSPFIFANLVMDTNAYDINVSPDKRTIMLHDQSALLESLKEELRGLFARQEHTVPQSQLLGRKITGFKPLTVSRRETAEDNEDGEDDGEKYDGEQDGEAAARRPGSTNGTTGNIIHSWLGRDTEDRKTPKPSERKASDLFSQRPPLAKPTTQTPRAGNSSQSSDSLGGEIEPSEQPVDDDHTLEALAEDQGEVEDEREASIPAASPSTQKLPPGTVQSAFDRMRPERTLMQNAQITIGDKTTSTVLGGGSGSGSNQYKKRRIHEPVNLQAIERFGSSPLLTRGLRDFGAPGSQVEVESPAVAQASSEEEGESEVGEEDEAGNEDGDALMEGVDEESAEEEPTDDATTEDARTNKTAAASDALDDDSHEDYLDETEKRAREEKEVARLIQEAEDAAVRPTDQNLRRASQVLKNGTGRKESTLALASPLATSIEKIERQAALLTASLRDSTSSAQAEGDCNNAPVKGEIDDANAEARLSLTISKGDFARMKIVGQFNLGFILAIRLASNEHENDELFIIDQHAADEKYNYERLQRTVTLQNQRLVRPKLLDLTAVEEEIVLNDGSALKANGFEIELDATNLDPNARPQYHLLTLPMSKEKTFDLSDLEELLHLLSESAGATTIARPKKIQRLLAMRACRSSIMVGKTLTLGQMRQVVRHMGDMEKPWNCPHGRPTMRHLASLGGWGGWSEGDNAGFGGGNGGDAVETEWVREAGDTDWKTWVAAGRS